MENNNHKEIIGAIQALATHVDERIDAVRGDLTGKIDSVREDLTGKIDSVREDLTGKIDSVREDLTGQVGNLRSNLIDHVSRTVGDAKGDIVHMLKTDRERHKLFHEKILSIMERNKLARSEEIQALKELAA